MELILYYNFQVTMAFLARQNRQNQNNEPVNRGYARGMITQPDKQHIQIKLSKQEQYKLQLQRQIEQKQQRKRQQKQKIRKQDEKFQRQIKQLQKKQKQRKQQQKQKQNRILQFEDPNINNNINQSPKNRKQQSQQKTNRNQMGSLNISVRDSEPNIVQMPKLGFSIEQYQNENIAYSGQQKRAYLYQENSQVNSYYEERIRRHKEQLNQKLDQLFHHIHSTKDNIKADEQIDKIKRKLRAKQTPSLNQWGSESQTQPLQFQNKFYQIPKGKSNSNYNSKSRMLEYQSSSKFSSIGQPQMAQPRTKTYTQNDDFYSLPQLNYQQQPYNNYANNNNNNSNNNSNSNRNDKWGSKPGKDNFLGNRQAIDYQAEKTLGEIDSYLGYLKNKQD